MSTILVTGSEGLIGREIVEILKQNNSKDKIICADLKNGYDLTHFKTCLSLCTKVDEVYNLAGVKGSPKRTTERPADFFAPIVQMNTNMLEAARLKRVKKFVYVSSIAVENMETDYYPAWAKLTGEKQIDTYRIQYLKDTQFSVVRPANIYGRYDNFENEHAMVITSLIKKALIPGKFLDVWGDGSQLRDFVNAIDAAQAMMQCMKLMPQKVINICSGVGITIKEVAELIAQKTNKTVRYDTSKPTGAKSRVMRFDGYLIDWKPTISIETGIDKILEHLNDSRKNKT